MASPKHPHLLVLLFALIVALYLTQGANARRALVSHQRASPSSQVEGVIDGSRKRWMVARSGRFERKRRVMIGSTAPTCTYNECRGCKYKCRAEQVPVEGNDPMNSAYHYKCVCHR